MRTARQVAIDMVTRTIEAELEEDAHFERQQAYLLKDKWHTEYALRVAEELSEAKRALAWVMSVGVEDEQG